MYIFPVFTVKGGVVDSNLDGFSSCSRQIIQWLSGSLRPPTRSNSSHSFKQQVHQNILFGKVSSLNITTHSTGILPYHQLPLVRTFYFKAQNHLYVLQMCLTPPGSVYIDLFALPIGVKHPSKSIVHTSSGNCSPASNSSASDITASCSKWTKCHFSGYITFTPFGHKSFKSCLLTSQELKVFQLLGKKCLLI